MPAKHHSFKVAGTEVHLSVPQEVSDQLSRVWSEISGAADGATANRRTRGGDREPLTKVAIVDTALAQMRANGYDAVTMRSISKELGTGPASLYAHVANREELDALVLDRVSSRMQIPEPDAEHWREQLHDVGIHMLALYRDHPGVARAALGMIPMQPGPLVAAEKLLAILKAGNVADQEAAWFIDLFTMYVGAVAVEEDVWRLRGASTSEHQEEKVIDDVHRFYAALPPEHFPLLSSMAATLTAGDGDQRFVFGLDLLISGLATTAT